MAGIELDEGESPADESVETDDHDSVEADKPEGPVPEEDAILGSARPDAKPASTASFSVSGSPSDELVRRNLVELSEHRFLRTRADALVSIAEAVSTGEGAHDWARVDLGLLFSDDAVVHSDADDAARRLSKAESFRNVSVFFPLMITWLGIATATFAYGQLVDAHPSAARRPFIQLWEQRFVIEGVTGPANWWVPSFSAIAFLDFLAILGVVVLSIWAARIRFRLEVTVVEEEAEVQNQLASTIGDAAVILARRSLASPTNFNETMNRVADQMSTVQSRISAASRASQRSLDRSTSVLSEIDTATGRLAEASSSIAASLAALEPILQGARTDLQQVAEVDRDLAEKVGSGLAGFSTSQSLLSMSSQALSDSSTRIEATFAAGLGAATSMQESAAATSALLSKAAEELQALDRVAAPIGEVMDRLNETAKAVPQAAQELGASASKLDRSAGQLAGASSSIGDLPKLLRDASAHLRDSAEAQRQLLEALTALDERRRRRNPFRRRRKRRPA